MRGMDKTMCEFCRVPNRNPAYPVFRFRATDGSVPMIQATCRLNAAEYARKNGWTTEIEPRQDDSDLSLALRQANETIFAMAAKL